MREILFRGKRVDTGEWVEGYLIQNYDREWYICPQLGKVYGPFKKVEFPFRGNVMIYQVNPDTVGQFTGLVDKNGTEIFEGDVIKYSIISAITNEEANKVGPVVYMDQCFMPLNFALPNSCVVIGNIHDKPELAGVAW